jgi:hypothetical protein
MSDIDSPSRGPSLGLGLHSRRLYFGLDSLVAWYCILRKSTAS